MTEKAMDLDGIQMVACTNKQGDPFVNITASSGNRVMLGMLTPTEVRTHALAMLSVAEAAEQDAAVVRVILNLELPLELAGAVVVELRKMRAGGSDEEESDA